jgi:NACalpha-BTF3-like transcription factor
MASTKLKPRNDHEEIWEVQIPGTIYLQVTTHNRHGQSMDADLALGPNKVGHQFRISDADRVMNQERIQDSINDPFTNGMLIRCDADQQADEDTASDQALSAADLTLIFDQHGAVFENAIRPLGEINLRRLLDIGSAMDASHKQIETLEELIRERYGKGGAQDLDQAQLLSGGLLPG